MMIATVTAGMPLWLSTRWSLWVTVRLTGRLPLRLLLCLPGLHVLPHRLLICGQLLQHGLLGSQLLNQDVIHALMCFLSTFALAGLLLRLPLLLYLFPLHPRLLLNI